MGLAGCSAYGSHIGLVAIASIGDDQRIKVHRLIAAVDCGFMMFASTSSGAPSPEATVATPMKLSGSCWFAG